jgi:hypothetical protein
MEIDRQIKNKFNNKEEQSKLGKSKTRNLSRDIFKNRPTDIYSDLF